METEKTGHIDADRVKLPRDEKPKEKMTTFWVSPTTWKHVQEQRELGETVDECLQRLIGMRRQGQLRISAELMAVALQNHFNFPQKNIIIRGASFNPYHNTVSFLLEGDEFPPVPEGAEPEFITVNEQAEEYVRIESDIEVIIEIIDDKGNPAAKPVRLPGGTLNVCERGLTLIIKKPLEKENIQRDRVAAAREYIAESLRLHNEGNTEGSLTMLREAHSSLLNSL